MNSPSTKPSSNTRSSTIQPKRRAQPLSVAPAHDFDATEQRKRAQRIRQFKKAPGRESKWAPGIAEAVHKVALSQQEAERKRDDELFGDQSAHDDVPADFVSALPVSSTPRTANAVDTAPSTSRNRLRLTPKSPFTRQVDRQLQAAKVNKANRQVRESVFRGSESRLMIVERKRDNTALRPTHHKERSEKAVKGYYTAAKNTPAVANLAGQVAAEDKKDARDMETADHEVTAGRRRTITTTTTSGRSRPEMDDLDSLFIPEAEEVYRELIGDK